jgi:hypothetical protein
VWQGLGYDEKVGKNYRLPPFGYLRIIARCQLPEAFRRLLRPSSPLTAKASTVCAYSLDIRLWRKEGLLELRSLLCTSLFRRSLLLLDARRAA